MGLWGYMRWTKIWEREYENKWKTLMVQDKINIQRVKKNMMF